MPRQHPAQHHEVRARADGLRNVARASATAVLQGDNQVWPLKKGLFKMRYTQYGNKDYRVLFRHASLAVIYSQHGVKGTP